MVSAPEVSDSQPIGGSGAQEVCWSVSRLAPQVFDEVDEDQDGALNSEETNQFVDALRSHVAHAVYGGGGDEADQAVLRVLRVLSDSPEGDIKKDHLGEAAVTHFFPELLELVHELFDESDQERGGGQVVARFASVTAWETTVIPRFFPWAAVPTDLRRHAPEPVGMRRGSPSAEKRWRQPGGRFQASGPPSG